MDCPHDCRPRTGSCLHPPLRVLDVQVRGAVREGRRCFHGHVVTNSLPLYVLLGQWFALHGAGEHCILARIDDDVLRHRLNGGSVCMAMAEISLIKGITQRKVLTFHNDSDVKGGSSLRV